MPEGRLARTRAAYTKPTHCPSCGKWLYRSRVRGMDYLLCGSCGWMPAMHFITHFVEGSPNYEGTPRQTGIITNIEEP